VRQVDETTAVRFHWKSKLILGYSLKTRRFCRPMEETMFQSVIVRLRPIR
jgi:hypothetical protein